MNLCKNVIIFAMIFSCFDIILCASMAQIEIYIILSISHTIEEGGTKTLWTDLHTRTQKKDKQVAGAGFGGPLMSLKIHAGRKIV